MSLTDEKSTLERYLCYHSLALAIMGDEEESKEILTLVRVKQDKNISAIVGFE